MLSDCYDGVVVVCSVVGSLFYSYITFTSKHAPSSATVPLPTNTPPATGVSVKSQQTHVSEG